MTPNNAELYHKLAAQFQNDAAMMAALAREYRALAEIVSYPDEYAQYLNASRYWQECSAEHALLARKCLRRVQEI